MNRRGADVEVRPSAGTVLPNVAVSHLNRNSHVGWSLLIVMVLGCAHCERDTRISLVDDRNPPVFGLHGNGNLNFFWVSEVGAAEPIPEDVRSSDGKNRLIWEIWPSDLPDTSIGKLPRIAYGKVPDGFNQKIPAQAEAPALIEGKIYEAGGPSSNANMQIFRFTIRDGKAVSLELPEGRYR